MIDWREEDVNRFFSYHKTITYYGDEIPKYLVLENPDGDGWIIGMFYPFIGGEYVPLEEAGDVRLIFSTLKSAKNYVDFNLWWEVIK